MKRTFEIEFQDEFGPYWINRDSLLACLTSFMHVGPHATLTVRDITGDGCPDDQVSGRGATKDCPVHIDKIETYVRSLEEQHAKDVRSSNRLDMAVTFWNEHKTEINQYMQQDAESEAENSVDFKWNQLVWQEVWMWIKLDQKVSETELDWMCQRRGFNDGQRRFLRLILEHVDLYDPVVACDSNSGNGLQAAIDRHVAKSAETVARIPFHKRTILSKFEVQDRGESND